MTQNLFNWAAANPTLQPLPIDVVSVQSQVVYGRVGNNVAIPILESFGLIAAAVPTVMLSNTPHYPTIHGGALPTEWFNGYLLDLSARGALRQTRAILLGYLGNPAQAEVLARWISNLHDERPSLQVIVDPVIGDHDHGVYVDPGMIEAYRRHLLPLAHGLTPNGFELEHLTGQPAGDIGSVIAAARMLLTGRTQWVAVTSATPIALSPAEMQVAVVTRDQTRVLKHPRIATSPKGTGDLFAAALTGHLLGGASIFEAATQASNQVVIALDHTRRTRCAELMLPPVGRASCPG
ncbi:pyridoxal-pyridoxamine kinase/hydroxymethylpyrimidine kinase [Thiomonas sp. CB3]|nr:pyridoxal-pyridoxamine kinase/hydroxymethylpyrimidine kinase [Thiomonas sp. CB3]